MKAQASFKSVAGAVSVLGRQAGMTLVSSAVAFMVGGIVLTGAWMSFSDLKAQMHVEQADRQMDQYAHAAVQELTNNISWAWFGEQEQGGTRYTRWKFLMKDEMKEYGTWAPWYDRDNLYFTHVRFEPTRGIMFSERVPPWAMDRYRSQYVWYGSAPGMNEVKTMDRRDRMTMEAMVMERAEPDIFVDPCSKVKYQSTVNVEITMQYRYTSNMLMGMYPRDYVRERTYKTSIFMRNWDSDINDYRKAWVATQLRGRTGC